MTVALHLGAKGAAVVAVGDDVVVSSSFGLLRFENSMVLNVFWVWRMDGGGCGGGGGGGGFRFCLLLLDELFCMGTAIMEQLER